MPSTLPLPLPLPLLLLLVLVLVLLVLVLLVLAAASSKAEDLRHKRLHLVRQPDSTRKDAEPERRAEQYAYPARRLEEIVLSIQEPS